MIVHRCFPLDRSADEREEGGALWFPRRYQGDGRHDNPDLYGCLYVGENPVAAIAEQLQGFRGERRLATWMLAREALPLGLASIELPRDASLVDLDNPAILVREALRPSEVATRERARTRGDAASLFRRHVSIVGLRWWSTLEASWINVTLFDRVERRLRLEDQHELTLFDPVVREAAEFLGLG
ncbi:MAG: RES family NAD+ phosphorylase [Actinomycetota bacterium]|nr:RES family NAD+ phosphorylase [Actinomycetota bacterium]